MEQLFFWLMALALFLHVGDYITTVKAMDKGFVEANPINKFLFAKLGFTGHHVSRSRGDVRYQHRLGQIKCLLWSGVRGDLGSCRSLHRCSRRAPTEKNNLRAAGPSYTTRRYERRERG